MIQSKKITQLKEQAMLFPETPGVYQYFDKTGKIIYIGKAKSLRKRVLSYFNREHELEKTTVLVRQIHEMRYIVVDSEEDALLLEFNLIKKYRPHYNVMLKDGKSYPRIVILNEPFPRIYKTRKSEADGIYFGPYTSGVMVSTLIELFGQLYPLRSCALQLTQENIGKKRFRRCLEYHIGNCKAPCEGLQTEDEYRKNIDDIHNILKGNIGVVIRYLKESMMQLAEEYRFEEAEQKKRRLNLLQGFQSKSSIVNPSIDNVDVISMITDAKSAYVNFLRVLNGAIVQAHTIEIKKRLNESEQELLSFAIVEMRERFHSESKEIVVPFIPEIPLKGIEFTVPHRGDKKKLLELSERNVTFHRLESLKQKANVAKTPTSIRILETLKADLHMEKLPLHIECFDNSNIQGTHPVAACVVFKKGKPARKDYRHFNVKTVVGANDFATMEEIIYRRYKRLLDEDSPLPQLIVIDGGKGQLGAALNSLQKLNLVGRITVIGIAKRLEEIFFPGDPVPLYLDKQTPSLKLIQHLRNEAHRFGISFHRDKRSNAFLKSQIENIQGVGEKSLEMLLKHFKSVSGIKKATHEELKDVVGETKAKAVKEYFDEAG
jgi:excinuclease ABC subunit C